ncbi:LOW QUALITY PROTEIN: hypothetical protein V2J09_020354 [Rumex salicifolius]
MDSATADNVSAQVSSIPMLNGSNFKVWKENVEIVLGCMDLDLALRTERPILAEDNSNEAKVERWDRSNRMSLMIMKRSIPEAFQGSISESTNAKESLEAIQQYFAKNEKAETSNHLATLISMRQRKHKGVHNGDVKSCWKTKGAKVRDKDDFLVHLVLLSLPTQFTQFKVSYNTQKEKWTLNELISQCVQEEDRIQRDKTKSAHFASSSQNNRKNKAKDAAGTHMQKKMKKGDELTCFFCKKAGHMKKDCPKYAAWRTGCYLDLIDTFIAPTFKRNLISISSLDKSGYFCGFGNGKISISLDSNI